MDVTKKWPMILFAVLIAGCGGGGKGEGDNRVIENPKVTVTGRAALEASKAFSGALVAIDQLDVTQTSTQELAQGRYIETIISSQIPAVDDSGNINMQLDPNTIVDDTLYRVSVTCPSPATISCTLKLPLNAVMSGARLKQGAWSINVLTEVAYQNLAYYIATAYSEKVLQQEMVATASALLQSDVDGSGSIDYEDVLRWHPASNESDAQLKQPQAIDQLVVQLQSNESQSIHQLKVQTLTAVSSTKIGSPTFANSVALISGYAFIADMIDNGVQVVDVHDPYHPMKITHIETPGRVAAITIHGHYVYAVGAELYIIDIQQPTLPRIVGSLDTPYNSHGIEIVNDTAYLANGDGGVQIIDVHDKKAPTIVRNIASNYEVFSVAWHNGYLFVSGRYVGLHIFNTQNPHDPVLVRRVDLARSILGISIQDGLVYVAADNSGLIIVDARNPESAVLIGSVDTPGQANRVTVDNGFAYVADSNTGLQVINVKNPAQPVLISKAETSETAYDVTLQNGLAYVSCGYAGVSIIDVKNLAAPILVSSVEIPGKGVDASFSDNDAYLIDDQKYFSSVVQTMNIRDSAAPELRSSTKLGPVNLFGTAYNNGFTYVVGDAQSPNASHLWILDAGDPTSLNPLSSISIGKPNAALDVFAANDYAYVVGTEGLKIIDTRTSATPTIIGQVAIPGVATRITVSSDYAYVASRLSGLQILDVSTPNRPVIASNMDTSGDAVGVTVSNNLAYVADGESGVKIFDIREPSAPKHISSIDTPGSANRIEISNEFAYVADGTSGVQVINVTNPEAPILLGRARTWGSANDIHVARNLLHVTTDSGLEILREVPSAIK